MRYRESDLPNEEIWNNLLDPIFMLQALEVTKDIENYIDIGCGYGTFLIPAAKIIKGNTIGVDIEQSYLEVCQKNSEQHLLNNVYLIKGDISDLKVTQKINNIITGADYISLFNILHCEEPIQLIKKASELLKNGGKIGVIQWTQETQRGPSLAIRPNQETVIRWAKEVGLKLRKEKELPPYHFGLLFEKIDK